MIGEIMLGVEVATKVYVFGRWAHKKTKRIRSGPPSLTSTGKDSLIRVEYFSLTKDAGFWHKFKLGREGYKEENRLEQDKTKLIHHYPALKQTLLANKHVGMMPYEVLSRTTEGIGLSVQNTAFTVSPALRNIYEKTKENLVSHFRRMNIQYVPTCLTRACDWNRKSKTLTVEQVEYTDAAATNIIADLNIPKALGRTALLEGRTEAANSIRNYDLSLSKKPGAYPSLKNSSLANPIGVAAIAVTADDRLILTHRPRSVSTYAYKLGPSSSGYVTWNDVASNKTNSLDSILTTALKREIAEELHLDLSRDISELHSLGLYRELYRAGMPQAFYFFRTRLLAEQVVSRIRDCQDFKEAIGVVAIPVNRVALTLIISALVRQQKIDSLDIGLEAQGLLTALACNGEKFVFASQASQSKRGAR